jgi:hypothetical protein
VVGLDGCAYWNLVGIRARSDDALVPNGSAAGSVFQISSSDHVTLYRVYGEYNNRLYNTQVIALDYTSHSSVIESEVYDYHRHGIESLGDVTTAVGNVLLRNYANATPGGPCKATGTSDAQGGVHCGWDLVCDANRWFDPSTNTGPLVSVKGSSLAGAGVGGADLGANVTCLYDAQGKLTNAPMWNQHDGRFVGCDWYAADGADDVASAEGHLQRCSTVHTLVNVGANGGVIPSCP